MICPCSLALHVCVTPLPPSCMGAKQKARCLTRHMRRICVHSVTGCCILNVIDHRVQKLTLKGAKTDSKRGGRAPLTKLLYLGMRMC